MGERLDLGVGGGGRRGYSRRYGATVQFLPEHVERGFVGSEKLRGSLASGQKLRGTSDCVDTRANGNDPS